MLNLNLDDNEFGNVKYISYICKAKTQNTLENKKLFAFTCNYDTESELYRKVMHVYNIIADIGLTDKQIETLIMYIRYGYSRETKEVVMKELNFKSDNYIHVMNHKLKKKGMLVDNPYNKRKKDISEELQNIKDFVEKRRSEKMLPLLFREVK